MEMGSEAVVNIITTTRVEDVEMGDTTANNEEKKKKKSKKKNKKKKTKGDGVNPDGRVEEAANSTNLTAATQGVGSEIIFTTPTSLLYQLILCLDARIAEGSKIQAE